MSGDKSLYDALGVAINRQFAEKGLSAKVVVLSVSREDDLGSEIAANVTDSATYGEQVPGGSLAQDGSQDSNYLLGIAFGVGISVIGLAVIATKVRRAYWPKQRHKAVERAQVASVAVQGRKWSPFSSKKNQPGATVHGGPRGREAWSAHVADSPTRREAWTTEVASPAAEEDKLRAFADAQISEDMGKDIDDVLGFKDLPRPPTASTRASTPSKPESIRDSETEEQAAALAMMSHPASAWESDSLVLSDVRSVNSGASDCGDPTPRGPVSEARSGPARDSTIQLQWPVAPRRSKEQPDVPRHSKDQGHTDREGIGVPPPTMHPLASDPRPVLKFPEVPQRPSVKSPGEQPPSPRLIRTLPPPPPMR